jgi:drug/metabolite transporter (DMT)-like permease
MKRGHYYVILAGIFAGTIIFGSALFVNAGFSAYQITIFRFLFSLLLFPYLIYINDYKIDKKLLKILLLFALVDSVGVPLEFMPVILGVPVAITVLLLYSQPIWTVIFSKYIFKEKITKEKIISIFLVMAGIITLVNPFSVNQKINILGVGIALLAGLCLSGWTVIAKLCGEAGSHPVKTEFYSKLIMIILVILYYPIVSRVITNPAIVNISFRIPLNFWLYFGIFALVSNIIPHLFYYAGVKEIPASTAGVILLLEPLTGAILAAIFLHQPLTANIIAGGLLILAANYIIIRAESKEFPKLGEALIE